jgi:hypothetical protein
LGADGALLAGGGQAMMSHRVVSLCKGKRGRMHVLAIMSEAAITWAMPLFKEHPIGEEIVNRAS